MQLSNYGAVDSRAKRLAKLYGSREALLTRIEDLTLTQSAARLVSHFIHSRLCSRVIPALLGYLLVVSAPFGVHAEAPTRAALNRALLNACQSDNLPRVRSLLRAGAEVNARDADLGGASPLEIAVDNGDRPLVDLLLRAGADVNARDQNGSTPLIEACWGDPGRDPVIVRLLLAHGADPNARDNDGLTPLMRAAIDSYDDSPDIARLLVGNGAKVRDSDGAAALRYAAALGKRDLVRMLLARGAAVNAHDSSGRTALFDAVDGQEDEAGLNMVSPDVAQVLLSHGAKVNSQDNRGYTPLMAVLRGPHSDPEVSNEPEIRDAAQLLLRAGARVNIAAKDGSTALRLARRNRHRAVVRMLLARGARMTTCAWPVVRSGSQGAMTRILQMVLESRGYPARVDGRFGAGTARQVRHFQQARGLVVDGVAGGQTWEEVLPDLHPGSRGLSVTALQQLLKQRGYPVAQDGLYGRQTEAAIRRFQHYAGITVDGWVGLQTWCALFRR